jgi:phosphohistidine phosphatase
MESRHLVLLRHAKSSWDNPDLDDHDRPLSGRGRRAATQVGRYLQPRRFALVLCSTAVRAGQTLEYLQLEGHPQVRFEPGLYGAGADELLDRLQRIDPDISDVLLIGHNPGMHGLAVLLTGDNHIAAFPTAALAELRAPVAEWPDLEAGAAILEHLVTPKNLPPLPD